MQIQKKFQYYSITKPFIILAKNALKKILIRTPFLILKKSKKIEKFFNSRKKLFKIKIAIQISHPKHNKSVTQNTTIQSPKTQQICPIFIYY